MNNIYLASGFNRAERLRTLAKKLEALPETLVTSNWIYLKFRPDRHSGQWDEFAKRIAGINLVDLTRSNRLVVDCNGIKPTNHGGVHTELGWALACDWPIYMIGECENTFTFLPAIIRVENEDDLLARLVA